MTFWGERNELWNAAERAVLLELKWHDLTDAFRAKHGYDVEASSWIERRTRRGRRYDHMLASGSLGQGHLGRAGALFRTAATERPRLMRVRVGSRRLSHRPRMD